jgi:hypothetical protein
MRVIPKIRTALSTGATFESILSKLCTSIIRVRHPPDEEQRCDPAPSRCPDVVTDPRKEGPQLRRRMQTDSRLQERHLPCATVSKNSAQPTFTPRARNSGAINIDMVRPRTFPMPDSPATYVLFCPSISTAAICYATSPKSNRQTLQDTASPHMAVCARMKAYKSSRPPVHV